MRGKRSLLCSSAAGCEPEQTNCGVMNKVTNVVMNVCPDVDEIEAGSAPTGSSFSNVLCNVSLFSSAVSGVVHRESRYHAMPCQAWHDCDVA